MFWTPVGVIKALIVPLNSRPLDLIKLCAFVSPSNPCPSHRLSLLYIRSLLPSRLLPPYVALCIR